ncbi:hypothetical protein [Sporomusa sphaeroides]|uniref:hypothetical protein n=1 Tax=Sporomusa sphaeroides TaxID=47679 RepID=UPI002BF983B0|nr:hypothetical protein [Sporomusa sphaeroides]HML34922.1 hypothetical protein [Sporomusa sphaeroides]
MSCNTTDHEFDVQTKKINQFLQNVDHKFVGMSGKGGYANPSNFARKSLCRFWGLLKT